MCLFNPSTLHSRYCYSWLLAEKSEAWGELRTCLATNKFTFGSFQMQSGFAFHYRPYCFWQGWTDPVIWLSWGMNMGHGAPAHTYSSPSTRCPLPSLEKNHRLGAWLVCSGRSKLTGVTAEANVWRVVWAEVAAILWVDEAPGKALVFLTARSSCHTEDLSPRNIPEGPSELTRTLSRSHDLSLSTCFN